MIWISLWPAVQCADLQNGSPIKRHETLEKKKTFSFGHINVISTGHTHKDIQIQIQNNKVFWIWIWTCIKVSWGRLLVLIWIDLGGFRRVEVRVHVGFDSSRKKDHSHSYARDDTAGCSACWPASYRQDAIENKWFLFKTPYTTQTTGVWRPGWRTRVHSLN